MCAHCGVNIIQDEPIILGDFQMLAEDMPLQFKGRAIRLTEGEMIIVWSLLKSYPYPLKSDALLNRMDSEGTNNNVSVMIHKIRNKLKKATGRQPIENVFGRGYCWSETAEDSAVAHDRF